jgi:crotonobetainyl-CoA:carnitine CoA-transferase CaiB-like acyl-CoA transferase
MGVLAVLAALAYRDRTGAGQVIDLSMQDIAAWLTQTVWDAAVPASPPVRAMACRDGYVVGTSETEASAQELQQLTRNLERNEAVARLARLGVQTTPVSTVHEMLAHPQTAARGLWFLASEEGMTWPLLASPLRLSRPPPAGDPRFIAATRRFTLSPPESAKPMPSAGRKGSVGVAWNQPSRPHCLAAPWSDARPAKRAAARCSRCT